jgi:general secretion pathway protein G
MQNEQSGRLRGFDRDCTPPVATAKRMSRVRVDPKDRASGYTLVEILVALAVLMIISAIAVPHYLQAIDTAKVARAVSDVRTIGDAVLGYEVINEKYPDDLTQVGYGDKTDPWGQHYQYLNYADTMGGGLMRKDRFFVPINTAFDLYSMGKDGQSAALLNAGVSQDDVVWASDGAYIGLASDF